jgi:hypothetical protein
MDALGRTVNDKETHSMNELQALLDAHGVRNTGDDLVGFHIDLEAYLSEGEPEVFASVETSMPNKPDCMLRAVCDLQPGTALEAAERFVRDTWLTSLRYAYFEAHLVEPTPAGFIFRFVTMAPQLGVIGEIHCRKSDCG